MVSIITFKTLLLFKFFNVAIQKKSILIYHFWTVLKFVLFLNFVTWSTEEDHCKKLYGEGTTYNTYYTDIESTRLNLYAICQHFLWCVSVYLSLGISNDFHSARPLGQAESWYWCECVSVCVSVCPSRYLLDL